MKVRAIIDVEAPGLGKRIWKARKLSDKSLAQITEQVGMTPTNWYKIEAEGTKALPLETLRKIEQVLGVDLEVDLEANFNESTAA